MILLLLLWIDRGNMRSFWDIGYASFALMEFGVMNAWSYDRWQLERQILSIHPHHCWYILVSVHRFILVVVNILWPRLKVPLFLSHIWSTQALSLQSPNYSQDYRHDGVIPNTLIFLIPIRKIMRHSNVKHSKTRRKSKKLPHHL